MLLSNISVVLVGTRFPENIGMAARACANMGCENLILAKPEKWDFLKAEPLATSKGIPVLEGIRIYQDLKEALAEYDYAVATSARLGHWRGRPLSPEGAASEAITRRDEKIALVFGPEDRGLTNSEISLCHALACIPSSSLASSLNLSQAVLLMLYEIRKKYHKPQQDGHTGKTISQAELAVLENNLKAALIGLDCLDAGNPDYFFRLWHNMLVKTRLARYEYDALMGLCRQIKNRIG